jgi:hypothetical protein
MADEEFIIPREQRREIVGAAESFKDAPEPAALQAYARLVERLPSGAQTQLTTTPERQARAAVDAATQRMAMLKGLVPHLIHADSFRALFTHMTEIERELHAAEAALLRLLPTTPEQIEEVEQAYAEITASPESRKLLERMTGGFQRADLASLSPWAGLVLVTLLALRIASEPGEQSSNDLVVIAIVLAMLTIIQNLKSNRGK